MTENSQFFQPISFYNNIFSEKISVNLNAPVAVSCSDTGVIECRFINSLTKDVPTLSEWGLIAKAGVLGIVGFMVVRRR